MYHECCFHRIPHDTFFFGALLIWKPVNDRSEPFHLISDAYTLKGHTMAKGKNIKKETKKPKKEKPKISATANSIAGKPMIGAKK